MPIVSAVCPSCGGQLEVDNGKEAGVCKFCNNAFITEKAINNYHIKYEVKADTVIMNNKASIEELLEREAIYLKIFDVPHLEQVYEDMAKLYPKRHEGWWGKILLKTNRFSDLEADMQDVAKWFGLVCETAPKTVLPDLEKPYHSYIVNRMRKMLAEKEMQMQKADAADTLEQELYRNSIVNTQRTVRDDRAKAGITLAATIGSALAVIGFGALLGRPEQTDNDGFYVFMFLGLIGVTIALIVKLAKTDGLTALFGNRGMVSAVQSEYEDYKTKHSAVRSQAFGSIETLRKQIENYEREHGLIE